MILVALCTILSIGVGSLFSGALFVGVGVIIGHHLTMQSLKNSQNPQSN